MGFTKDAVDYRREYNLDDPVDREIVRVFERELEEFENREPVTVMQGTIFEKKLRGYDLYLLEKRIRIFTRDYPSGAMVRQNLGLYHDLEMKKRAVDNLRFRRKKAEEERNAQFEGTPVGTALEMLGGKVVSVDPLPEELEKKREKVKGKIRNKS